MIGITDEQYAEAMDSHIKTQQEEYDSRPECCGAKMALEDNGDTLEWYECQACGKGVEI